MLNNTRYRPCTGMQSDPAKTPLCKGRKDGDTKPEMLPKNSPGHFVGYQPSCYELWTWCMQASGVQEKERTISRIKTFVKFVHG